MKQQLSSVTLDASAGTIDFSGVAGFVPGSLLAVFDVTAGHMLFSPTAPGHWSGSVLTLRVPLSGLSSADSLIAIYDDEISPARESGGNLAALATASGAPGDAAYAGSGSASLVAALKGVYAALRATLTVSGTVTANDGGAAISGSTMPAGGAGASGWLSAIWSRLGGTLAVSASALPLPSNAAQEAGGNLATLAANAATAANQATANTALATIAAQTSGVATAANQSAANTSLAAISMAAGAIADAAYAGSGSASLVAALKGIYARLVGAATAANQTAVQSAPGTPQTTALTIQGNASGVAVPVALPSLTAGSAIVGKFGLDQTTPGTTNAVYDTQSAPFSGAVAMSAGVSVAAQRSVGVLATAAGNLTFTFPDASTLTLPVYVGWQTLPFAVTSYSVPGSGGATASVYNLK